MTSSQPRVLRSVRCQRSIALTKYPFLFGLLMVNDSVDSVEGKKAILEYEGRKKGVIFDTELCMYR
ncbi:hypothetical protein Hanom_Chr12g01159501 [Helianthus anomalus]